MKSKSACQAGSGAHFVNKEKGGCFYGKTTGFRDHAGL